MKRSLNCIKLNLIILTVVRVSDTKNKRFKILFKSLNLSLKKSLILFF